jgi:hypothetical protein
MQRSADGLCLLVCARDPVGKADGILAFSCLHHATSATAHTESAACQQQYHDDDE